MRIEKEQLEKARKEKKTQEETEAHSLKQNLKLSHKRPSTSVPRRQEHKQYLPSLDMRNKHDARPSTAGEFLHYAELLQRTKKGLHEQLSLISMGRENASMKPQV